MNAVFQFVAVVLVGTIGLYAALNIGAVLHKRWLVRRNGRCSTVGCPQAVEEFSYCRTCWAKLSLSQREEIRSALYTASVVTRSFHLKLAADGNPDISDIEFDDPIPNPTPVFGEPARIPGLAQLVTTTGEVWQ